MTYDNILKNIPEPGNFIKCFAFSIHKCGSSLMNKMIKEVCNIEKIPYLDIPTPMFENGLGPSWQKDDGILKFIKDGYIYLGYRNLPPVFKDKIDFSNSPSVLLIRDPRDALVSQYFSLRPGGSHKLPKIGAKEFVEKRKDVIGMNINEYVINKASLSKQKFIDYKNIVNKGNVKVFYYEDIFFNKQEFLQKIFEHFNIIVETQNINLVAKKNDIIPLEEDKSKHIRKGFPGDHRDKLTKDTIDKLNLIFSDVAEFYGYDLN